MKKRLFFWIILLITVLVIPTANARECEITENSFFTYYAVDYSNEAYCTGDHTIQNQGCFPLTIASVLKSYGLNVGPTDVSRYLCSNHKSDADKVTYGDIIKNSNFQNKFNMSITDISDTMSAIDQTLATGSSVLASIKKPSVFANNTHYIAIVKKDGNNYYVINTSSKTDERKKSGWYSKEKIQSDVIKTLNNGLWAIKPTSCTVTSTSNSTSTEDGMYPCGDGLTDCYENYFPNIGNDKDTDCDTIFITDGELNEFGEFLESIYLLIKIAAPVLVIVLSTIDYLKAIASSNADEIKKCNKRTIQRLIIGILIFFLPYLLDLIFHMFGLYDISRCNIGG